MGDVIRGYAVVVAQIPLTLVFHDGVMGSPAYNGIEDDTLIAEGAIRVVTDGVAQEVAVARGVTEVRHGEPQQTVVRRHSYGPRNC